MGEVYRARDARLRRDVALKVLHPSLAAGPGRVDRLAREARAAGSLNHPNIVAVFDVGAEGGVSYVVSELLEGESLRDRLGRGPLPYRKALEYGIQIAQALGAAHEKAIWHRDVKPANVFLTADGRVKLLDFGLARAEESEPQAGPEDPTASGTRPGAIQGTAGYMSPEQVLGGPLDHRADLFALGVVLYEMFTGARAFQRASTVETMNAVLREEPKDPLELNPGLQPEAAAVVRRCLEKNREERFQAARDLAFHLQQLHGRATRPRATPRAALGRRTLLALVPLAAVATLVAMAVATLPRPAPTFEQLTFRPGRIGGARFTSEGQAVVYGQARERNDLEVLRLDLADAPQSRSLDYKGAELMAAHAGELALFVNRYLATGRRFVGTLAVAPIAGGGAVREKVNDVEDGDWDPAGAELAVARMIGVAGPSQLEYPINRVRYKAKGSIRYVRVSRDGRRIAFIEDPSSTAIGGLVMVRDLSNPENVATPLTGEWVNVRGLAWSAGGDEIWFTAAEARTNRALRAVDLRGKQRVVLEAPASLTLWDIARDGRVLLTRDDERNTLVGVTPDDGREQDLSSFDFSGLADLSPDGRTLLFGGRLGLYIRRVDQPGLISLGQPGWFADRLSPDGQSVLATSPLANQLAVLPVGVGQSRLLPNHGIATYKGARWFPDGRRILFNGRMPDEDGARVYVQDASADSAAPPRPLTPQNTIVVTLSPNGKVAVVVDQDQRPSFWDIEKGTSQEMPGAQKGDRPVAWSADGRSLWVFRRGEVPADVVQLEIASGRRHPWKTLAPPDPVGAHYVTDFQITPAGHAYFYSYRRLLSEVYLARGLR